MNRVLPAAHEFVQRALKDFRVVENGQHWIARLKGEGRFRSAVFPEIAEKEPQVLVELIPLAKWERPSLFLRWAYALRLPYLAISILPLLLVVCARLAHDPNFSYLAAACLFGSVGLIHLGCNLWSDAEDHLRGVDNPGQSGGSGVIQKLWIPAVHIRKAAAALFLAGCALGILLLAQLPQELVTQRLLWLGLVGALGAASYSGWPFHYKYFGLGEPIVFLLSGPLIALGAASIFFADSGELARFALASLPLAFLVTLRLHAGNMQRIPFDSIAGVFTIARAGGFAWSKAACLFLSAMAYISVVALVVVGKANAYSAIVLLTLPLAVSVVRLTLKASGPLDPICTDLRRATGRFHLLFGLLYSLSFLA